MLLFPGTVATQLHSPRPPVLCISSHVVLSIFLCLQQREQWTVGLITSASNTLCLPLLVSLLLQQKSLAAALGWELREREAALIFLDCLFSCSAVFHLHFYIFAAATDTKCHFQEDSLEAFACYHVVKNNGASRCWFCTPLQCGCIWLHSFLLLSVCRPTQKCNYIGPIISLFLFSCGSSQLIIEPAELQIAI